MNWMHQLRYFFEKYGFEVSSRFAERLGMKAKNVRLFFIYVSFATFGAWFAVYLTLALLLQLKDLFTPNVPRYTIYKVKV